MALSSVYKKYFQKSKVFLYPILGIKRGVSVVPTETYISWQGYYTSEDMKLICVYDVRTDSEYKQFEKNVLLNHNRLNDYVKVGNQLVLTFDLSDLGDDWFHFINGRYSKISMNLKQKILTFFDKYSGNYAYMHSYLIPEKYFNNWLLFKHNYEPMNRNDYTKLMNKTFESTGKKISTTLIRKMVVSDLYPVEKMKKLSSIMGHSIKTAVTDYAKD